MYFSEFFIFGFCYWVSMYNVCQPRFEANRVLADVCSCFGRVVAKAVVSPPRLPIKVLPLVEERHQPHFALLYTHTPIDIQFTLSDALTLLVIRLYRCAEVVRDDGVSSLTHNLRRRNISPYNPFLHLRALQEKNRAASHL